MSSLQQANSHDGVCLQSVRQFLVKKLGIINIIWSVSILITIIVECLVLEARPIATLVLLFGALFTAEVINTNDKCVRTFGLVSFWRKVMGLVTLKRLGKCIPYCRACNPDQSEKIKVVKAKKKRMSLKQRIVRCELVRSMTLYNLIGIALIAFVLVIANFPLINIAQFLVGTIPLAVYCHMTD